MSGFVGITAADGVTPQGMDVYKLASNITLASGASTTPVTSLPRGSYLLDVSGTFNAGASLQLQSLGSDGTTWRNVGGAISAQGTVATSYTLAGSSQVRLTNTGSASVTGLYATLS